MKKQKDMRHSRMTSEGFDKKGHNNNGAKGKINPTIKQDAHRMEYDFMDGVLGCVK